MRWPRVRFTVRRTILAAAVMVAMAALTAGVNWLRNPERVRLARLRVDYLSRSEHHADLGREFARLAKYQAFSKAHGTTISDGQVVHIPISQRPELVPRYLELSKYHGSLKTKYAGAASQPRIPVAPDPPAPPEPA
jgi:hypothetical protein